MKNIVKNWVDLEVSAGNIEYFSDANVREMHAY